MKHTTWILQIAIILIILILTISGCSMYPSMQQIDYKSIYSGTVTLDPPELKEEIGTYAIAGLTDNLPATVDLSAMMPPAGNQGSQGSCTSWAVAWSAKTFQEGREMQWDLSVKEHQFSPAFLYNQIQAGFVSVVLNKITEQGCDTIAGTPYDQYDKESQPDAEALKRALAYRAETWQYVEHDVDTIKTILASNQVVIFVVALYEDFYQISTGNEVYDEVSGKRYGYHTLCMTGYDDNKQAFQFLNSWGANWGFNGYGWIAYDQIFKGSTTFKDAYIMIDAPTRTPASTKTIHYYNEAYIENIHYQKDDGSWTKLPGKELVKEENGWSVAVIDDHDDLEFCFTDGWGDWDSNNGYNYHTTMDEVWIYQGQIHPVNPLELDEDSEKSITFITSEIIIVCDEWFPYTLKHGTSWYGFEIEESGTYTLEWDVELTTAMTLYLNDLSTPVNTIRSNSTLTIDCDPGRYFLMIDNIDNELDTNMKLTRI